MKKLLTVLLVTLMMFSLTGCLINKEYTSAEELLADYSSPDNVHIELAAYMNLSYNDGSYEIPVEVSAECDIDDEQINLSIIASMNSLEDEEVIYYDGETVYVKASNDTSFISLTTSTIDMTITLDSELLAGGDFEKLEDGGYTITISTAAFFKTDNIIYKLVGEYFDFEDKTLPDDTEVILTFDKKAQLTSIEIKEFSYEVADVTYTFESSVYFTNYGTTEVTAPDELTASA